MLVFIDYEHARGHRGEHGERLLAARARITYRLEDISGRPCHLVRYDHVDHQLLARLGAEAIFISGNATDPNDYEPDDLASVEDLLRTTELPVFGLCGGFQLLARALGSDLVTLTEADDHPDDHTVHVLDDGRVFEFGYHPVDLVAQQRHHPLLDNLPDRPVFRHAHGLHVPDPPEGFEVLASTRSTPVQLAVHDGRRMAGSQFHPEYWTADHPEGRQLLQNFLRWTGIAD